MYCPFEKRRGNKIAVGVKMKDSLLSYFFIIPTAFF
jgi:hypothetical protein